MLMQGLCCGRVCPNSREKWGISSQKLTFSFPQSLLTCARSLEGASSPGKLPVLTHGFALWAFLQITPKSCAPGPNLTPGSSHDSEQEHPLQCFPPRLVSLLGLQTIHHLAIETTYE